MRHPLLRLSILASFFVGATAARALTITLAANLSGAAESPPNASPGTGWAIVTLDTTAHTLSVQSSFSGLLGTTTAAHIHAPTAVAGTGTAGVSTQTPSFVGFPLGVTAGTFSNVLDTTLAATFNAPYITANGGTPGGAEAALYAALADGRAYFNIHTSFAGGGEIRGFLVSAPEGGVTAVMLGVALCVAGVVQRRKRLQLG